MRHGSGPLHALVVSLALAACDAPAAGPNDAAVDAAAAEAMVDAPLRDAAEPDVATADAPVDAAPIDAPIDAIALDGPPIVPLPLLVPDPSYAGDGVETLPGNLEPTSLATSGPRIGICGTVFERDQTDLFRRAMFGYRTRPGATENILDTMYAAPPATQHPRGCQRTVVFPDGQATFVVDAGFVGGATWLMRRDGAGLLTPPLPSPQVGAARGLHPLASHGVALVFDDAAWVLDAALQPVSTVGAGGRIAVPGPVRATLLRPGERLDVVTDSQVIRFDLATGARDASFGVGGAAALPGPALTIRGAVPLPDQSTLVVGVGAGAVISPAGQATRVTLPAIDARVVVEDRAGGAYLITAGPPFVSTTIHVTQIGPSTPTAWEAGSVSALTPDSFDGFLDTARPVAAQWTDDGKLAITSLMTHFWASDANHARMTSVIVVHR